MTETILTPQQLELMTLRYVDRASLQQISSWLNITRDTVRRRLRTARRKLELRLARPIPPLLEAPITREISASDLGDAYEAEFLLFDSL